MTTTEISIQREDDLAIVSPNSDIVASSAPALRAIIRDAIAAGATQIRVDLKAVEMVDSTGLGLLVSVFNTLQKSGGQFSIVNASDEILRFFQAMRLSQHFSITGSSPK